MNLTLVRYAYLPTSTSGILYTPALGAVHMATIEEPWNANPAGPGGTRFDIERVASCVPDGEYRLVPHDSAKHGAVWALVNPALGVYHWPADIPKPQPWGRFACLIHVGNTTKDIEGCIAAGLRYDPASPGVFESNAAIGKLREILGRTEHRLTIRPRAGTSETL